MGTQSYFNWRYHRLLQCEPLVLSFHWADTAQKRRQKMNSFNLPWPQIVACLVYGLLLSLIYLGLLWLTIKSLPQKRHKGLWLYISGVLRLVLFLSGAILFSQNSPARFLWIIAGFIITRLIFVGFIKTKGAV